MQFSQHGIPAPVVWAIYSGKCHQFASFGEEMLDCGVYEMQYLPSWFLLVLKEFVNIGAINY